MLLVYAQVVEATTANGVCTMRIRAVALPGAVATALDENADLIRMTLASAATQNSAEQQSGVQSNGDLASADGDSVPDSGLATDTGTNAESASATETVTYIADTSADETHKQHDQASKPAADAEADPAGHQPAPSVLSEPQAEASVNGQSSSADADSQSGTHDSSCATATEALSDAGMIGASESSQAQDSSGGLIGADRNMGKGMTAVSNGDSHAHQQGEEERQLMASGKVGILKQRLVAAAKEAQAGSPEMLEVPLVKDASIVVYRHASCIACLCICACFVMASC